MTELSVLIPFLALVALGSYVQTVTGFALGLIVMGAVSVAHLAPIPFTAVVVSIMSLFNTSYSLVRVHREVDRRILLQLAAGMLTGVPLGLWLLTLLDSAATQALRTVLGLFLLGACAIFMFRPQPRPRRTGAPGNLFAGLLGGLGGGMFSTAGPPLVYHLYREPVPVPVVRVTLLAAFTFTTLVRLALVWLEGGLSADRLSLGLLCVPVVLAATWAGRRWRPPLSDPALRRLAFALLGVLGVTLVIPA